MRDRDDADRVTVFKRAQLFELLQPFERRWIHAGERLQELAAVSIESRMLTVMMKQARVRAQRLLKREAGGRPYVRHGRARKIEGEPGRVRNDFDDARVEDVGDVRDG